MKNGTMIVLKTRINIDKTEDDIEEKKVDKFYPFSDYGLWNLLVFISV